MKILVTKTKHSARKRCRSRLNDNLFTANIVLVQLGNFSTPMGAPISLILWQETEQPQKFADIQNLILLNEMRGIKAQKPLV